MPIIKDSASTIASVFYGETWRASDRLSKILAAVPLLSGVALLVDGGFKAFGKPGPIEGFLGTTVNTIPDGNATEKVGHLALAVVTLPANIANAVELPFDATGGIIAAIPGAEAADNIGGVVAALAGATTTTGMAGLVLAGGTPNQTPRPTP